MTGFDGGGFYNSAGGALPWGSGGAGALSGMGGSNPAGAIAQNYASGYQSALDMNKANYSNILSGYQGALRSQQAAQASIGAGYAGLTSSVLGGIQNIGNAQSQAITDRYRSEGGKANQQLIDRGLGNTTVQSAVTRGNEYDREKAQNLNTEAMAGLRAQYGSQLGLADLAQQRESYQNNTGLLGRQLDWMNSVNAKYPDASLYSGMLQQAGQKGGSGGGPNNLSGGGGGTPGLGYSPRPVPANYASGEAPGAYGGIGGFGGGSPYSSPYGSNQPDPSWQPGGSNYGGDYGGMPAAPMQGFGAAIYGGAQAAMGAFGGMAGYGQTSGSDYSPSVEDYGV